jgi:hypothetical protein
MYSFNASAFVFAAASAAAFAAAFAAASVAAFAAAFAAASSAVAFAAAFAAAFATASSAAAFAAASSVAAFATNQAWMTIKAVLVASVTPPVAPPVAPPVVPDAPEPQLVSVLATVPDDDWSKSWPVDKTLMLKMTSKSLNEVINKMQLPKPEITVTLRFDNTKESELKMKSLSMFVKKNKIPKLELKCYNVRINRDDLHKVALEQMDDPEEWFEKVSEHCASLAILNDQANSFEPVLNTWYAYWIPGGPHILWSFQP